MADNWERPNRIIAGNPRGFAPELSRYEFSRVLAVSLGLCTVMSSQSFFLRNGWDT